MSRPQLPKHCQSLKAEGSPWLPRLPDFSTFDRLICKLPPPSLHTLLTLAPNHVNQRQSRQGFCKAGPCFFLSLFNLPHFQAFLGSSVGCCFHTSPSLPLLHHLARLHLWEPTRRAASPSCQTLEPCRRRRGWFQSKRRRKFDASSDHHLLPEQSVAKSFSLRACFTKPPLERLGKGRRLLMNLGASQFAGLYLGMLK